MTHVHLSFPGLRLRLRLLTLWSRSLSLLSLASIFLARAPAPALGAYKFMSVKAPGLYLTALMDKSIVIRTATNANDQIFDQIPLSMTEAEFYNIVTGTSSSCSNMCLDVVTYLGYIPAVTQVDCNPGKLTQYWTKTAPAVPADPGYLWLQNYGTSSACMTAETWTTPNYVDIYTCTDGAANQLWSVSDPPNPVAGGSTVNSKVADTYLTVGGGSPQSGARTTVGPATEGAFYQHFTLFNTPKPWGYQTRVGGGCLEGGAALGGSVSQDRCIGPEKVEAIQWIAAGFQNDGLVPYRYLVNLATGFCLTMDPSTGSHIFMTNCIPGNANQQWQMIFAP